MTTKIQEAAWQEMVNSWLCSENIRNVLLFCLKPGTINFSGMDPADNDQTPQQFKYQVTIHFEMDENFMSLVAPHRTYINYLINKNIIDSYTVSLESMRSWVVMNGASKEEIMSMLEKSPLYKYWTIEIDELYVVDGQPYRLPALQPN
jgi:hypothetical protein